MLAMHLAEAASDLDNVAKLSAKRNDSAIKSIVQDSPISKALNGHTRIRFKNRASDIHIEPPERAKNSLSDRWCSTRNNEATQDHRASANITYQNFG